MCGNPILCTVKGVIAPTIHGSEEVIHFEWTPAVRTSVDFVSDGGDIQKDR